MSDTIRNPDDSNVDQPIKKFLEIITEATVTPPVQPTRASCIAQIKDMGLADQVKTIRRWLDRKRIGPSLYNDLMQYAKSNHWTKDTNQTNETNQSDQSEDCVAEGGDWTEEKPSSHPSIPNWKDLAIKMREIIVRRMGAKNEIHLSNEEIKWMDDIRSAMDR